MFVNAKCLRCAGVPPHARGASPSLHLAIHRDDEGRFVSRGAPPMREECDEEGAPLLITSRIAKEKNVYIYIIYNIVV